MHSPNQPPQSTEELDPGRYGRRHGGASPAARAGTAQPRRGRGMVRRRRRAGVARGGGVECMSLPDGT
jgi:hypothetical protein